MKDYPQIARHVNLEDITKRTYDFPISANLDGVFQSQIKAGELSDTYISQLSERTASDHPDVIGKDVYFTLREGSVNAKNGLGMVLVSIEYNYAEGKPRIRVAGTISSRVSYKRKSQHQRAVQSIRAKLMKYSLFQEFVKLYLRKSSQPESNAAYTGAYQGFVWYKGKAIEVASVNG